MTINPEAEGSRIIEAAHAALSRGFQPVPIRKGSKAPAGEGWTHRKLHSEDVPDLFAGVESLGLRLGSVSDGLVDVDLDHPLAWRLRHMFLPPTPMRTGRVGNAESHFWYRVPGDAPGYRKYTLPKRADGAAGGETLVELRSTPGHQTLIPPSVWYPKKGDRSDPQPYRWEGEPWGGELGPTEIDAQHLAVRVASLALTAILIENWPKEGSRHDAYLALAGGMLRLGDQGVHPYWQRALPQIIEALAEATHDHDGPHTRVGEVVPSTEAKLKVGGKVHGWTTLEDILGKGSVDRAKSLVREIEDIVEWKRHMALPSTGEPLIKDRLNDGGGEEPIPGLELEEVDPEYAPAYINPLDDRAESWEPVNLEPYLAGEVVVPEPTILRRTDGHAIFYPGRVNSLYGRSESAKSWVAMWACVQEMSIGERVIYVDLEDDPAMAIHRIRMLGAGDDDVRSQFTYLRPEGPHSSMQRDVWGNDKPTEIGHVNAALFDAALDHVKPGLVVVDGMSVLYGLHGLNTNDVASTDVITNWLKSVTRNGRTTVIVIDHTGKGAEKGATPIGSQHKISMVQGSAIQVHVVVQPMPNKLGHVELVIGKDRPGKVREVSSDQKIQVAADVWIDSTGVGTVMTVNPPAKPAKGEAEIDASNTRPPKEKEMSEPEKLRADIRQFFEDSAGIWWSTGDVEDNLDLGSGRAARSTVQRILGNLAKRGILEHNGEATSASKYRWPEPLDLENPDDMADLNRPEYDDL